jgi:hypothetical protein
MREARLVTSFILSRLSKPVLFAVFSVALTGVEATR